MVAFDDEHHVHRLVFLILFFARFGGLVCVAGRGIGWPEIELVCSGLLSTPDFGFDDTRWSRWRWERRARWCACGFQWSRVTDMPGRNCFLSLMRMRTWNCVADCPLEDELPPNRPMTNRRSDPSEELATAVTMPANFLSLNESTSSFAFWPAAPAPCPFRRCPRAPPCRSNRR